MTSFESTSLRIFKRTLENNVWSGWYSVSRGAGELLNPSLNEMVAIDRLKQRILKLKKKDKVTATTEYKITKVRQILIKEDLYYDQLQS